MEEGEICSGVLVSGGESGVGLERSGGRKKKQIKDERKY